MSFVNEAESKTSDKITSHPFILECLTSSGFGSFLFVSALLQFAVSLLPTDCPHARTTVQQCISYAALVDATLCCVMKASALHLSLVPPLHPKASMRIDVAYLFVLCSTAIVCAAAMPFTACDDIPEKFVVARLSCAVVYSTFCLIVHKC